jgi:cytochrome c oxidase assembly factor CtaG
VIAAGALSLAAATAYLAAALNARRWPWWRTASFVAGAAVVFGSIAIGDRTLVVHMVGHALLVAVAPPLIVLGRPVSLALRVYSPPARERLLGIMRSRAARALLNPALVWIAFVATQFAFHMTALYDLAERHVWLHELEHGALLVTALVFWSVALAAEPLPRRLSAPARFALLMSAMPASDAVAIYLIAHGHAAAGAAMAAGMMPLGVAAVAVGWSWIATEERHATLREALDGAP